mgnify:CR=1 FL=1
MAAGQYIITVTDLNNCEWIDTVIISVANSSLSATISSSDYNGYQISCNGGTDSAIVSATGGPLPYTYLWSNGQIDSVATNLVAGNYTVTVTDATGCTFSVSVTLNEPTAVSSVTTSSNISCNGFNNGSATVVPSGGVQPYTLLWSTNDTSNTIDSLMGGSYSCTITDDNGCSLTETVNISNPDSLTLSASITDVGCYGDSTGSISITTSGGTPNYTYSLNGGIFTSNSTCLLYTSPSPRDGHLSRMPSSA